MEPSPNKNERYLYRYGPAIVFLLNTGLRGDELLALGKSSIVPFLGRRGIKITHTLCRVKNREAGSRKRTKMILTPPKYPNTLHALRHTFATNLIRQTHNMGEIKEAAEIIGDNYDVIMRTYVHTDSERKVSLIDAMIA